MMGDPESRREAGKRSRVGGPHNKVV